MFSKHLRCIQQIAGRSKLRPGNWLIGDRYALNPLRSASAGASGGSRQPRIVRRQISVHALPHFQHHCE
jgi:hypothetical protein